MKTFILCLIILLITSWMGSSSQISGTVVSKLGEPISGVRIRGRADNQYTLATTDEKGNFDILQPGKIIFLQALGYRPVVLVLNKPITHINVEMEEASISEFKVPTCLLPEHSRDYIGHAFMLRPPQGAITVAGKGSGDLSHTIYYQSAQNSESLVYYWSSTALGIPDDDWILGAKNFSIHSFRFGQYFGIDIRGISKDGKHWRFLGDFGGMEISYRNASKEAADYFDKIIGSLCLQQ